MKPDQHKKKKNAEYKKKHGIQNQGKNKNVNKSNQDGSKPRSESSNKVDSFSEEDNESENHQHFSRRQIESNWDRYKEEDADEDIYPDFLPTKIGADFQTLLDKKGSSSSHFQFHNEKEWENISENEEVVAKPLAINFKSLAQSLKKIPLDEQFEIDEKYFEDWNLNVSRKSLGDETTQNCPERTEHTFPNFSRVSKHSQKPKSYQPDSIGQSLSNIHVEKPQNYMNNVPNTNNTPGINEDEFLNSLLREGTKETETCKTDFEVDTYSDKRPNALLSNDNSKTDMINTKSPQDTKEDLEDWLDSILD